MDINELKKIIASFFTWHKSRTDCFAKMIMALMITKTVNMSHLAHAFEGKAQPESCHKRIKRFFSQFHLDFSDISAWIVQFFALTQALSLCMDRTNWKWGKKNINILMLSVAYNGLAVPIFWTLLPKRGNSNTVERIGLIERFIQQFGTERIESLLADREFIGENWFSWLNQQKIKFCIRIKNNSITTYPNQKGIRVDHLFRDLKIGEQRRLSNRRYLWGCPCYLSALRLNDGELLMIASNHPWEDPIKYYGKRWQIETLFGCLKTKGFNFEDTHLTDPARIEKLIVLLTVALCWCYKVGEWRHERQEIKLKKHGRKAQSIFRYGLDMLTCMTLNVEGPFKKYRSAIHQLLAGAFCQGMYP